MWVIRTFEESVAQLERGDDPVAAGVCRQLSDDDAVYCGRRAHAQALATGSSLEATMAELMGRAGGLCKGLGGPGHLVDVEHGLMGSTGGNPAVAAGSALAAKLRGEDQVVVAFLDEPEAHGGRFAETVALTALWGLPVIFVCETGGGSFVSDAVAHHGIPSQTVDGNDVVAVWESFAPLLAYARAGHGPLLLECLARGDEGEREDPIRRFQRHGVAEGWFVDDDSGSIELESRRALGAAVQSVRDNPAPTAALSEQLTFAGDSSEPPPEPDDPRVFVLGEGSLAAPVSRSTLCGVAIGAAQSGMRPVVNLSIDAIGMAAAVHATSGGQLSAPLVLRTRRLEAGLADVPGLKVAMPGPPADAAGLLAGAIADPGPVVLIGPEVPPRPAPPVPLGSAMVLRAGSDVTIVALGRVVEEALAAAQALAGDGVDAEVIDPRTLIPLDVDTIVESVRRTNRLVVAHDAVAQGGFGAELAARVQAAAFDDLDSPVERVGAPVSVGPLTAPGADQVRAAAMRTMRG
jgi:2-oxoisovalerate dehydrogenase E1 component